MRPKGALILIMVALVVALTCTATAQAETQVSVSPALFVESPFQNTVTNVSVNSATSSGSAVILVDEHIVEPKHPQGCKHNVSGWNSGEKPETGELYWFWDTHMTVCPDKHSPTGYVKTGGGMTGRNCGNAVKLHSRPHNHVVARSHVRLLPYLTFTAKVIVTASAKVEGSATATCALPGVSASSSVNGLGTATATAEAVATGYTKVEAVVNAENAAVHAVTHQEGKALAEGRAEASSKIEGKASAFCHSVTPPPPSCKETGTCPPPEEECLPPSIGKPPHCKVPPKIFPETIQEVLFGLSRLNCAVVEGENISSVRFEPEFGHMEGPVEYKSELKKYCQKYVAPTEEVIDHVKIIAIEESNPLLRSEATQFVMVIRPEIEEPPR